MKKTFALLSGLLAVVGCSGYKSLNVDAFAQALQDNKGKIQLVDVRTADEYAEGHLDGAVIIDVEQEGFIEKAEAELSKSLPVAVYCRTGKRSATAASKLAKAGFEVLNLKGGITAWTEAAKPVFTDYVDMFVTPGGNVVRLHCLVHASVRLELGAREIEIDPVSKMAGKEIDYSAVPCPDLIFVTHEHPDHFDMNALELLGAGDSNLYTNLNCAVKADRGHAMSNGDVVRIEDLTVEAVPAYNYSENLLAMHPKGRDNGLVMTWDGFRIYFAGDTEDIEEMKDIKDIDVAFFPCNRPTMTVDQLVRAAEIVKPRVLFPYHFGNTDVSVIPERLEGIDVRIRPY